MGLASSSLAILAARALSGDDFLAWGWRLPFLLSAVLVVVRFWVRSRVVEAEEFTAARRSGTTLRYPLAELVRRHRRMLIVGVAATFVCHAAYIVTTFLPAYATTTLGVSSSWSLVALVVASALGVVVLAVVGRHANRADRRRYAAVGAVLAALWVFRAFALAIRFGARVSSWAWPAGCRG